MEPIVNIESKKIKTKDSWIATPHKNAARKDVEIRFILRGAYIA